MKKLIAAVAVCGLLTGMIFAEAGTIAYTNTLASDIVNIVTGDDGSTTFAGISDTTDVDFTTERFDAGINVTVNFNAENGKAALGYDKVGDYVKLNDWYIEFRPVKFLTFGLNDLIYTKGSLLPVAGKNAKNGDVGSDMVVVLRPVGGMRIAGGLTTVAVFGDDAEKAGVNFGADYTADAFSIGFALRSISDEMGFGFFGSINAVKGLDVNFGYSGRETSLPVNGNVVLFGLAYNDDSFNCGLDFASNFADDAEPYDLYTAGSIGIGLTKALSVKGVVSYKTDLGDDDENAYVLGIEPSFAIESGHSTFSFGIHFDIDNDTTTIKFPVSWKYAL